ncbi:MAG TPA: fumarylacetoacetate hydrolase family protein [Terriglobales bacterium]|nr:fumarylacetoacetate hydrolase family protein [Terriglobales bacterium]
MKRRRIGVRAPGGEIVDLTAAYAFYLRDVEKRQDAAQAAEKHVPPNMRKLFMEGAVEDARKAFDYAVRQGPEARGPVGERIFYPAKEVTIKAPIIPRKFFHTAGNFREHHEEAQKAGFSHPVLPWIVFFQNIDAIVGPDEPVVYPSHLTQEVDYELELAVVIGKTGKHFTEQEAPDYIAGYVIFNDVTARDIQRREMKSGVFSFCKGIDTFCPLGPHIVTADEIPDPHNLAMELRVNGEVRQRSHSSKMAVKIPQIIAHYSAMGYSAGDVLSTGTVSGVAAFSGDPKAWYLKPGDVMECEIEKIGVLRNPVISWEEAHGGPPPKVARATS